MGSNVELGGLRRWQTSVVTVTSTAAVRLDTSALAGRNGLEACASTANTATVFVGPSSSVSSTAGRPVSEVTGPVYLGLSTKARVWGKAASGSQSMHVTQIA